MTIEAKLDRIIELLEARAAVAAPPTKAAKKPRKDTDAPAAAANDLAPDVVPAPVDALPVNTQQSLGGSVQVAKLPTGVVTLDDVRIALVECQTRLGSKAKPLAVLTKYTPGGPHTTGTLKVEDYAKVIAECKSSV